MACVERRGRWGLESAESGDALNEAQDGAELGVAGTAMANGFISHAVVLACEGERGEGCCL